MTNIDFLQDLDLNEEETIEYICKLEHINKFKPLNEINIAIHNDKIVSPKLETYLLGTFSTKAFNVFIDKNLKDLFPLLKKLHVYYEKLNMDYEFNEKNLIDIQNLVNIIIDEYKALLIFHLEERAPFDIMTTYEVYEQSNNKKRFVEYLKSIIKSLLSIADTIVLFHEVFYTFSEQLMTLRSKIYVNDLGLAFDDYFLKEKPNLLNNEYRKFIVPVLPREIYSTSTFTNMKLPNSDKKVMVESITFNDYSSFLQYEYFKSLEHGHTVRICKNCKRAFLQTTKAHTIYCDRLYKDTNKTCRQYGPTRFHKEKVEDSPIHILYDRCKNKIEMRLYRLEKKCEKENKRVSQKEYDNYNKTAALIVDYKEQALNGEISVIELEKLYDAI